MTTTPPPGQTQVRCSRSKGPSSLHEVLPSSSHPHIPASQQLRLQGPLRAPAYCVRLLTMNDCELFKSILLAVPGCRTLAANLLARLWNKSDDIQKAETFGAAKKAARKLSKSLLNDQSKAYLFFLNTQYYNHRQTEIIYLDDIINESTTTTTLKWCTIEFLHLLHKPN